MKAKLSIFGPSTRKVGLRREDFRSCLHRWDCEDRNLLAKTKAEPQNVLREHKELCGSYARCGYVGDGRLTASRGFRGLQVTCRVCTKEIRNRSEKTGLKALSSARILFGS